MTIIISLLMWALTIYSIYLFITSFAYKPSRKKLASLQNSILIRYTSRSIIVNDQVIIKPSNNIEGNISFFIRPVTWFFIGQPDVRRLAMNNISNCEIKIEIPFNQLDHKYVIYRSNDNVIGYLKTYSGSVKLLASDLHTYPRFKLFRFFYKHIQPIISGTVLVVLSIFHFGFDLGMKITLIISVFLLTIVFISRMVRWFYR